MKLVTKINLDAGGYKTALLAAFAVLALASQCAAAQATSLATGLNSTTPGGIIFDGTNNWVSVDPGGLCQMDAAGRITNNCVKPTPTSIIGQPAFGGGFLYLPDTSTASKGIWRYSFANKNFNTPVNIAAAAGLGAQRPGAVTLAPDGTLLASMTANSSIVAIATPNAGAAQTVTPVGTTLSGNPAAGIAMVGLQLWIADTKGVLVFPDPLTCGGKCKGALLVTFGIAVPTSIVFDNSPNSNPQRFLVYIGTTAGVFRNSLLTGLTDLYSESFTTSATPCVPGPACPGGLFSDVTAVGVNGAGDLFIVDDPSAGQGAAAMFKVPAGSAPDGQGSIPTPPSTIPPTISLTAIANPGSLFSSGLTTPNGAVFLPNTARTGGHIWVVDGVRGFCKVDRTLPSPSLTACVLPAGFVPGQPAFDPTLGKEFVYLADTAGAGGILRFPFNTALETLGAGTTVVSNATLIAAAAGATAPSAITFSLVDKQLYAALAGVTDILRVTGPATAQHLVTSIGKVAQAGSVSIGFLGTDLYDAEITNVSFINNATLCKGTCVSQFVPALMGVVTAIASDANFLYIGEIDRLWRFDPVTTNVLQVMADTGLLANGTTTPFGPVTGVAIDNAGVVYAVDQPGRIWSLSTAAPVVTSVLTSVTLKNQAPESSTNAITITGSNFTAPLVVSTCASGSIIPSLVNVVSPTQISATFAINPVGPLGACAVTVTTANGFSPASAAASFTVLIGPPALSTVTPSTGNRGATVIPVKIAGANMTGGTINPITGIAFGATTVTDTLITTSFVISPTTTLGTRNVIVTTPSGPSNTLLFTVAAATPALTSINTATGVANTTVPITLTGTDLFEASAINTGDPGITATILSVVSPTQVNASLGIAPTVAAGTRNITITTPGGTSAINPAVTFKILPALTGIATTPATTPPSARAGASTTVTLTGTSLAGVTSVNAGPNITAAIVSVTPTTVTATFTSLASAPVGPVNVTVTDAANGTSAVNPNVTFTLTGPIPVINTITPNTGGTGATVPITISGTGLTLGTLTLPAGVTVVPGTLVNSSFTTLTASLLIAGNAPLGLKSISVITPGVGNTSNAVPFTIFALAPLISTISPTSSAAGTTTVTINGQGFTGVSAVNRSGIGIAVSQFTVVSPSQITATFVIDSTAASQSISVTNPNGISNAVPFAIVPTLASIVNSATGVASGIAGQTVPVTLTGSNLTGATSITTGTAGITATILTVNPTQITATFAIAAGAVQGTHNIAVVTPGGTTPQVVTFNVLPPAPVITSLNNNNTKRLSNVGMNVNGTNLGSLPVSSLQILLNGAPINPAFVTITNFAPSQTQIRFNWTFNATAPLSDATHAYTLTVTTPSGTSTPPTSFTVSLN